MGYTRKYLILLGWGTRIRTLIDGVRVSFLMILMSNIRSLGHAVSQNVTKFCYIPATILAVFLLSGCADFKHYTDANIKWSETEAKRMAVESDIIMAVASLVIDGFTKTTTKEASPLFRKTYIDEFGNEVNETVFDNSSQIVNFLIAQQKTRTLEVILPIIHDIFIQQQLQMDAPVTLNSVALAFVQQIPLMATVGGMYSLGAVGIKNAGDNITSVLSAGEVIAGSPSTGISQPTINTETTTTTTQ